MYLKSLVLRITDYGDNLSIAVLRSVVARSKRLMEYADLQSS